MEYLGKYNQYILNTDVNNILPFFQTTQYGREILESDLLNYNIKDNWKVEKEIYIPEGNVSSILYLGNNIIVFSVNNSIKIYNIEKNEYLLNIERHNNIINDLLKIDNYSFISSSKDGTIKYFHLTQNYSDYSMSSFDNTHKDEVNQTIKLKANNYFASCSNDKKICIWSFAESIYNFKKNLIGHESEVLSILELPINLIVSISRAGFLKFWDLKKSEPIIKTLEISDTDIPLHHSISLFSENLIAIGTNRSIIFVDPINKEIKLSFSLNFISTSFCNFYDNIIFGLKDNDASLIRECELLNNNNSFSFNCIAEGSDEKSYEISYIQIKDKKSIITASKDKYIKLWEKGKVELPKIDVVETEMEINNNINNELRKSQISENKDNNINDELRMSQNNKNKDEKTFLIKITNKNEKNYTKSLEER